MDTALFSDAFMLLAVLFLVLANGFFVAAEFALVTVRKTRINQLINEGNQTAQIVARALKDPEGFISATQLGITMASLALGWIGEPAVAHLLEPALSWLPAPAIQPAAHTIAVIIAFTLITYLHVVLGELAPKSFAIQRSEQTALWVARPIEIFLIIFKPAIWFLNGAGTLLLRAVGLGTPSDHQLVHSEEELKMLVSASHEGGVLEAEESRMLQRIFHFADIPVRQVMIPRTEIVSVHVNITLDDLLRIIEKTGYTRLPVYEETTDRIIGIIHSKDLLSFYSGEAPAAFNLQQYVRPVSSVPEARPVDEVLATMRRNNMQMMIVLDEYGGTAGLVTLEDLVEEIVGDVEDEFDPAVQQTIVPQPDGTTLVDGLLPLETINEHFGLSLSNANYDTIGGVVFGILGRKPEVGDSVTLSGYTVRIEIMDNLRVARLRLIPQSRAQKKPTRQPG